MEKSEVGPRPRRERPAPGGDLVPEPRAGAAALLVSTGGRLPARATAPWPLAAAGVVPTAADPPASGGPPPAAGTGGAAAPPTGAADGTAELLPAAGTVVAGRFRIERALGAGGMGSVLLAHDTRLDRRVALKFLLGLSQQTCARFLREAQILATLRHPGVVQVHDYLETEYGPCLILEYVEGEDLFARMARAPEGRLPPSEAVRIACDVCAALAYIHEREAGCAGLHAHGIVHRDVKPSNVLLGRDGMVKLVDFGLARAAGGEAAVYVGTPGYMAPEQEAGGEVDARADVFGLGATLYAMLVGEKPRRIRAELLPAALRELVLRALEEEPALRFQSAAEMARALTRAWPGAQPADPAGGTAPPPCTGLATGGTSTLTVHSDPEGAEVLLQGPGLSGEPCAGTTPVAVTGLRAGKYALRLRLRYHAEQTATFHLGERAVDGPRVRLEPYVAELHVTSAPAGARVTLDGRERATTPIILRCVRAGAHRLGVRAEGYWPVEAQIEIEDAGARRCAIELEPIPAFVEMVREIETLAGARQFAAARERLDAFGERFPGTRRGEELRRRLDRITQRYGELVLRARREAGARHLGEAVALLDEAAVLWPAGGAHAAPLGSLRIARARVAALCAAARRCQEERQWEAARVEADRALAIDRSSAEAERLRRAAAEGLLAERLHQAAVAGREWQARRGRRARRRRRLLGVLVLLGLAAGIAWWSARRAARSALPVGGRSWVARAGPQGGAH